MDLVGGAIAFGIKFTSEVAVGGAQLFGSSGGSS